MKKREMSFSIDLSSGVASLKTIEELKTFYSQYHAPASKLTPYVEDGRPPVVLLSCGAFSPPTLLHLRLMEDARDALLDQGRVQVLGGYMSPVNDAYGKKGLLAGHHRVNMVAQACESSDWISVEPWEAAQEGWSKTQIVINHIIETLPTTNPPTRVLYTCGADQFATWNDILPDGSRLWAAEDVEAFLQQGVLVFNRDGNDLQKFIDENENIKKHEANIHQASVAAANNVSSSIVRRQIAAGKSIKYLVPDVTVKYINEHLDDVLAVSPENSPNPRT